jgi:hypothetical protein
MPADAKIVCRNSSCILTFCRSSFALLIALPCAIWPPDYSCAVWGPGRWCCRTMQSWSCAFLATRAARRGSALTGSSGRSCSGGTLCACACPPTPCQPSPRRPKRATGSPPSSAALAGTIAPSRSRSATLTAATAPSDAGLRLPAAGDACLLRFRWCA